MASRTVSITMPAELYARMRAELGGLNLSGEVRALIGRLLVCDHRELLCRDCGTVVVRLELVAAALDRFYVEAWRALDELVARDGTVEGAARVVKAVAERWGLASAVALPLPRRSRAQREAALAAKVAEGPGSPYRALA